MRGSNGALRDCSERGALHERGARRVSDARGRVQREGKEGRLRTPHPLRAGGADGELGMGGCSENDCIGAGDGRAGGGGVAEIGQGAVGRREILVHQASCSGAGLFVWA